MVTRRKTTVKKLKQHEGVRYISAHWNKQGKYYGYPQCCIESFCAYNGLTKAQHAVHNNTGFVPCHQCATKILEGKTTLESLITNRICSHPFPIDGTN